MQNLQRYYGFSAQVTTLLEPERLEQIQTGSVPILEFTGYNPAEYNLYCHQLQITLDPRHWSASIPIYRRLESLRLSFLVNPKQRRSGSIMFFNWRFDVTPEEQLGFLSNVTVEGGLWDIRYSIERELARGSTTFKNAIVTFVRRDVRHEHRKIKIELTAIPTGDFEQRFRKRQQATAETRLDLRLVKPMQWAATLRQPPAERSAQEAVAPAFLLDQMRLIEQKLQKEYEYLLKLPQQTTLFGQLAAPDAGGRADPERRRLARIRRLEADYAALFERLMRRSASEHEVLAFLATLDGFLAAREETLRATANPQLLAALEKRKQLSSPDLSADSRLKLAISIIPLFLQVEVEFSPDGMLREALQRLKNLFGQRQRGRRLARR